MSSADETELTDEPGLIQASVEPAAPLGHAGLLLDLGELGRKEVRRLKRGKGLLARQIQAAVEEQFQRLGMEPTIEIVPVVLLYECATGDDEAPDSP
jgi:hypothetical protein